jgi:hypothetical protein
MRYLLFLIALPIFGQQSFKNLTILSGGTLTVTGSMSGTHGQNVGTGDNVRFNNVRFDGSITSGTTTVVDVFRQGTFTNLGISGNFTGTHAQNVGSGDTVTFAGIHINSDWTIDNTTSNELFFRDSGGTARLTIDVRTAGKNILAPTGYFFSTDTGTPSLVAGGITSQSGNVFEVRNVAASSVFGVSLSGALSGAHAQNVGTGDGPTFNTLTATTSSSLGIASASFLTVTSSAAIATLGVSTSFAVGSSALTVDSSGNLAPTGTGIFGGKISSTGGDIQAASGHIFKVGGTAGITSATCTHWTGGICDTP